MVAAVTPKPPDPTPALSFAAVTRRRQAVISPPVQLAARQYGLKNGKPTVSFTQAELQPGIDRLKHSLIAKFSAGRPGIEDVRRLLIQAWGIDEPITIGAMDARHILIIIPSAVLANQILSHPARKVGNYLFRLFRWAQDFKRKKEPTTTTSWIRLPGLPTELFNAGYIQAITSPIGRFLAIDEGTRTSRNPSFARACVEIDLSKPVLDEVWINMGVTGGFWQEIVYENKLLYCSHCKLHGHSMENCRKVKTKIDQEQLIWAARDEFGLSTVKVKDTVPQDKHGEPKSLSKNKEHVSSLSATEQEKGWMVVQKKKGKLTNVPLDELPVAQSEKQQRDLAFEKEGCINSEPKVVSGTQGISTNKKKPKGKAASVPAGPFPLGHEKQDVAFISSLSNESNPNGIPSTHLGTSNEDMTLKPTVLMDNAANLAVLRSEDDGDVSCMPFALIEMLDSEKAPISPNIVSAVPSHQGQSVVVALNEKSTERISSSLNIKAAPFLPGHYLESDEENDWIPARKVKQMRKMEKQRKADKDKLEEIKKGFNNLFPDIILSKEDKIRIQSSCNSMQDKSTLPPLSMYRRTRVLDNEIGNEDLNQECRRSNPYID